MENAIDDLHQSKDIELNESVETLALFTVKNILEVHRPLNSGAKLTSSFLKYEAMTS